MWYTVATCQSLYNTRVAIGSEVGAPEAGVAIDVDIKVDADAV
jgi:hypothetical protein